VRIGLLGGFGVSVGSRVIQEDQWPLRKASSLIKLLALAEGHRLHREQAMELLWPDLDPRAAANNLHHALHVARRTLEPSVQAGSVASAYLHLRDGQLTLCPERRLWVDVEAFEEAAVTARHAAVEPAAFKAAVDLYAGELLPRDRYEPWVEERCAELRGLYLSLLTELAAIYEERGEYRPAVELLRRVVAEEPTREGAHMGLMRLYALSGRRSEALGQYEGLRESLSSRFGAEPQAAATRLQQEIRADTFPRSSDPPPAGFTPEIRAPTARAPARGTRKPNNNLPLARTSFVGRGRERLEVKRLLAMTSLLTLMGVGGCGKTRLALEVARDLVGAYQDGAWLVELAPLSEAALVPKAVAEVLGVPERPAEPLAETLAEVLRDRHLLLVLDNCEHLLEAVARLLDPLLDSCPRLHILATSREALGVEGEVRWTVSPLSMPEVRDTPSSGVYGSPEGLEAYESVRLFVERARGRDPTFSLSPKNAAAVGEICRVLEGIPLAIELAAARVGILSAGQISERLADSLKLLKGSGTQLPRQRTLRGTLDWSYGLILDDEKRLFGRLSSFAGGWTIEAAEVVGGDVRQGDVLDVLSGLVEKSLVLAEATGEGDAVRYRLLEPIRQYAREKLGEGGESEAVLRHHADFFLTLAEQARPKLRGPEVGEWSQRLETEHDNMRTALSWALETGETELALRLSGVLGTFWYMHSHSEEGRKWLEAALARDNRAPVVVRIKALEALFWLAFDQWDHDRAEAIAQEATRLSAEAEKIETSLQASLSIMSAGPAWVRGDYQRGKELLEQSLQISRKAGDRIMIAEALIQLAATAWGLGDRERGKEIYEEGIVVCREAGYTFRLSDFLFSMGYQLILAGEYERGAALNEEAVAICREHGYKRSLNFALDNLGWASLLQGEHDRARGFYRESLSVSKELGDKACASESLDGLACIAGSTGEVGRAATLFGAAEAMRETIREAVAFGHTPQEAAWREPSRTSTRSRLGEEAWEEALSEGRSMGLKEAIEYALSEEEEHEPPTLIAVPGPPTPPDQRVLTAREQEIAILIGWGLTNRQIAEELSISEHTAANHVHKILKKLGVRSRTQITPSPKP
jgi:predicted ATPase/DNA-binding SARP family transcriptional activator/DNA-binding CsgD family transcriptional regulator